MRSDIRFIANCFSEILSLIDVIQLYKNFSLFSKLDISPLVRIPYLSAIFCVVASLFCVITSDFEVLAIVEKI